MIGIGKPHGINNMITVNIDELIIGTCLPTEWRKSTALFNKKDSMALLNLCSEKNIAILSIEGFIKNGDCIVPDMNCIIDFSEFLKNSNISEINNSINITRDFILHYENNDILIEFLLVRFN